MRSNPPVTCVSVHGYDWEPTFDDPEVQKYLLEEAGEEGIELFQFLLDNEPITGVEILEAHNEVKPSAIRKVLYRLMQAHALEYDKETDASGWETFHWRSDLPEIKLILVRRWQDELAHLRKQIKFEEDHEFYACKAEHRRMMFEDAMDIEFHCPSCNEPMNPIGNDEVMAALNERLHELSSVLGT